MKGPLKILAALKTHPCAAIFLKAVDPDHYPDYYQKIRDPIDLSLIQERLEKRRYQSLKSWERDMRLIHENTVKYFGKNSPQTALSGHLMHLFEKEFERCTEDELGRWSKLWSAHTNRVLHKLSTIPEILDSVCAIVGAFSLAVPVEEANVQQPVEEVPPPQIEPKVVPEPGNGISVNDQDRFLKAVGRLQPREAKGFVQIVQRFHPHLAPKGTKLEIRVEELSTDCWKELIEHAQRRFRDQGWIYPL
jgi:hypothetical protein